MTIYTVVALHAEYNDNDYDVSDSGAAVKAYRSEANAIAERNRLDVEAREYGKEISSESDADSFYKVVPLEVEEDEIADYDETREQVVALQSQAKQLAKGAFEKAAAKIFADNPKLESFAWTQYTPYFNDGNACTFRVDADCLEMKFDGEEYKYVDSGSFKYKDSEYKNNVGLKSAYEAATTLIQQFGEDDLSHMFGDHVKVVVTINGAEAEDYEHD